MKKLITALVCASTLLLAHADQKLIPAQSEITFVSKQMGVSVDGKFKKFDAQVAFDPKKLDAAKVVFSIDLTSVSMGAPEAEVELRAPGWFNSAKVPQAGFVSTSIKSTAKGKFEIAGKLTIKGVSKDVLIPAVLTQAGNTTLAVGSFTIKRTDFKVGEGEWSDTSIVANDVLVKFKLALSGVGAL